MDFKDLKVGDKVYILENAGTFRKINTYNIGTITQVSAVYDDTTINNPYLSNAFRGKVVDVTISCEGITKKITVNANKATTSDSAIGLTVSTSKDELITQIKTQCKEYEDKIAAIEFYKEELSKCNRILQQLEGSPATTSSESIDTIKVS